MGAKIPQKSSSRPWLHSAVTTYPKVTQKRRIKSGGPRLRFIRAHIQLAGHDLTNNHTFKLLSCLLKQTSYNITIAPQYPSVNYRSTLYSSSIRIYSQPYCLQNARFRSFSRISASALSQESSRRFSMTFAWHFMSANWVSI